MKRVLGILTAAGLLGTTLSTLSQESKDFVTVFTAEQAAAGERSVQNNEFGRCSDCHANGLAGRNGDPNELPPLNSLPEATQTLIRNGGKVPQLAGPEFMTRWATRSTKALSAEMRGRFAGPLNEETRLNIMAYILQLNGAVPGPRPLTESTDVTINRLVK
jgi:mono/diheme cytochrome c family protein